MINRGRPDCLHCVLMSCVQEWPEPFEARVDKLVECIADLLENARRQHPGSEAELIARARATLEGMIGEVTRGAYKQAARYIPSAAVQRH